ncbi:hypothetical protein AB6N24_19895 [Cellulomonas sp. 179-A 4D5 NHS]|uniref:hypothetical protein n=1 Tax=Cellulomonas sp. 179-A 4D5 NHS TaxID=3142378 RepID=UPI0039A3D4F4
MSVVRPSLPPSTVRRERLHTRLIAGPLALVVAGLGLLSPTVAHATATSADGESPAAALAAAAPIATTLGILKMDPVLTVGRHTWVHAYFRAASGSAPSSGEVEIAFADDVVDRFTLNATGSFSRLITVPSDIAPGEHVLTVRYLGTVRHAASSTDIPVTVQERGFVSQTPTRILDSRVAGTFCTDVRAAGNLPAEATGLMLNVTTAMPSGGGNVVVYPDTDPGRTPVPAGSTVNFEPGRDVANSAYVELPANGRLCYTTVGASSVRIILDATGYTTKTSGLMAVPSTRLLDTRPGGVGNMKGLYGGPDVDGPLPPRAPHVIWASTPRGMPSEGTMLVNATVTGAGADGHLRVFPENEWLDLTTSLVNYAPGVDKANTGLVRFGGGKLALYSDSTAPVHVIVDALAYALPGSAFTAQRSSRVLDTRNAALSDGPVEPRSVYSLDLTDKVPSIAKSVVLNVTAVRPTTTGHLRVFPDTAGDGTTTPPDASTINYIPGRDIPNQVVLGLPENKQVAFYSDTAGGSVDLVVDVVGYVLD